MTTYLRKFVLMHVDLEFLLDDLYQRGWQRVLLFQFADGRDPTFNEAFVGRHRISSAEFYPVYFVN